MHYCAFQRLKVTKPKDFPFRDSSPGLPGLVTLHRNGNECVIKSLGVAGGFDNDPTSVSSRKSSTVPNVHIVKKMQKFQCFLIEEAYHVLAN